MTESSFERFVLRLVKSCGGLALKWVSPGCTGVPDRVCFFPGGRVVFIELKRPGRVGGLSPRQQKMIARLRGLGAEVWVLRSADEAREHLRRLGYDV